MPRSLDAVMRSALGDNRILVAGAGGLAVFLGAQYWARRAPAASSPVGPVIVSDGVPPDQLVSYLGQFAQLGAGAAASGFEAGAGLGAAAFGAASDLGQTAIDVVGSSLGGAVGALAGSQAAIAAAALDAVGNLVSGTLGAVQAGSGGGGGGSYGGGGTDPGGGYVPGPSPITTPPITPPTGAGPAQNTALFHAATIVYARHGNGYIGEHKTFGQAGLRVRVNPVVVPRDPVHQTGGNFWEMKEGGATGWLIRQSDPNVTVMPNPNGAAAASAAGGGLMPVDQGVTGGTTSAAGGTFTNLTEGPHGLPLDPTARYSQAQLDQIASGNYSYTPGGTVVAGVFGPIQGRVGAATWPSTHGGDMPILDAGGNIIGSTPNPQRLAVQAVRNDPTAGYGLGSLLGNLFGR